MYIKIYCVVLELLFFLFFLFLFPSLKFFCLDRKQKLMLTTCGCFSMPDVVSDVIAYAPAYFCHCSLPNGCSRGADFREATCKQKHLARTDVCVLQCYIVKLILFQLCFSWMIAIQLFFFYLRKLIQQMGEIVVFYFLPLFDKGLE